MNKHAIIFLVLSSLITLFLLGCAPVAAPSTSSADGTPVAAQGSPSPQAQSPSGGTEIRIVGGSAARYRAQEQLAGRNLPSEAVGVTKDVAGSILLDKNGAVLAEQSKLTVDLRSLKSDDLRRDRFLLNDILQTARFPNTTFTVREIQGLSTPLPTSGERSFKILGNLEVKGVSHPITWEATVRFDGKAVMGRATTSFTFANFRIQKPNVFLVVSIEDTLKAEITEETG